MTNAVYRGLFLQLVRLETWSSINAMLAKKFESEVTAKRESELFRIMRSNENCGP